MKLYFSTIRIALPNTEVLTYWESGHPDEYDVQELFARSARYHTVAELLAEGGSWFALEHDGLVSRRLSAAQAESLKCRMR